MIVIIGLIILVGASGIAATGVATNLGSSHQVGDTFALFGQHPTGLSTGQLFAFGVAVGAIAILGLSLVLGPLTRRFASRGSRRELKSSRQETTVLRQDRDQLRQKLNDENTAEAGPGPSTQDSLQAQPESAQPSPVA